MSVVTIGDAFLSGGGQMGARVRSLDWAASPLGPPAGWPQSLRTSVSLCLMSHFPSAVCWGPEYALIYNDAYQYVLGSKHPWALGRPTFEVWGELADIVKPLFDGVIATGEPAWSADTLMPMARHGYLEEAYFTVFYSAIRGDSGSPEGIFAAVTESTDRYVAERRLRLVRDLGESSVTARSLNALWDLTGSILGRHPADLPFSLLYAIDQEHRDARLAAVTGIEAATPGAPERIDLAATAESSWPLRQVLDAGRAVVFEGVAALGVGSAGPWPEAPSTAVLLPIRRPGYDDPVAVLVAGVNPRRALDAPHLDFFGLVARQIANASGSAAAHEESRRQAEAFAKANRELGRRVLEQQTLLDVLPIGIGIATDPDCREIRTNHALAATLGVSPEANASKTAAPDVRPTNFRVLTPDGVEIPDDQLPMQVAAREGREVSGVEFDIHHDDGRVVRLLEYAAPLFDEDGRSRGAVGAFVDLTERKKAEIALQQLYRDLEQANRLKDEFLATLSHELRTPLNAVLGWIHMLREGAVTAEAQAKALESVERNGKALAQLVDDLLDVSRILSGKLQIKAESVPLSPVVTNALDTVRAAATAKGLILQLHEEAGPGPVVIGDADRLQQVIWNLVSNAIKFTPPGGRIDVRLRTIGAEAEISVTDTGRGFSIEFKPHLFERFRQMDASTARPHGGLGLGLSIVRQLTEAHGGSVEAESGGTGQGATFRVRLPLYAVP
jgi:PAS domain S-box-containing protein